MKVWVKLAVGAALGVILGLLLPENSETVKNVLGFLETVVIRFGRYAAMPLVVFSLTIAIYELRADRRFWPLFFRSLVVLVVSAVFIIAIGIAACMVFPPTRIPIIVEEQSVPVSLHALDAVMELFPSNMFAVFLGDSFTPLCVFAFLLAMAMSFDRNYTKPVIALLDSLSRIFYHIAVFFSEILGFAIIVLAAYWSCSYRAVFRSGVYQGILLLLAGTTLFIYLLVMPLSLYLLKPKTNPWRVLYGSIGPGIAAFFSGDIHFCVPLAIRTAKENLGIKRRANALTVPFFATFGRAGSGMAAAIAFLVIIRSYSSLGIPFADIVFVGLQTLLISFLLVRNPGDAAYTALAVLCLKFGRGFENGYLILKPIAFFIIACGTFLDVQIALFASYWIGRRAAFQEDKQASHFM